MRSKSFLLHFPCPWSCSDHTKTLTSFNIWADLKCSLPAVEQERKGSVESLTVLCPLKKNVHWYWAVTATQHWCLFCWKVIDVDFVWLWTSSQPYDIGYWNPGERTLYVRKASSRFRKNLLTVFVLGQVTLISNMISCLSSPKFWRACYAPLSVLCFRLSKIVCSQCGIVHLCP